eukprot:TRINITY_DN3754_c0_g1_i2.p1 TRINITY_DN3754_c0_g1~~TRINITY_DN3754_c0_g1_i2.p1  ORF type:complete len:324 (-),score=64.29 TRINITY_DN3754_c0_g1_i2:18-932(-)
MEEGDKVKQEIEEAIVLLSRKEAADNEGDIGDRLLKAGEVLRTSKEVASRLASVLPSHSQLQLQQRINNLQREIEARNQQVAPTKKFSFRNRENTTKNKTQSVSDGGNTITPSAVTSSSISNSPEESAVSVCNRIGLETTITLSEQLKQPVLFSDLTDCKVLFSFSPFFFFAWFTNKNKKITLKGTEIQSLIGKRLKNCQVSLGEGSHVQSSIFLDECMDCVFVMSSQQLRVHNSVRCDFYLYVKSNPIIEESSALRFASFQQCLSSPTNATSTSNSRDDNKWSQVEDFNWRRAGPSPNWSLLL